jgi:hypothetical protein
LRDLAFCNLIKLNAHCHDVGKVQAKSLLAVG